MLNDQIISRPNTNVAQAGSNTNYTLLHQMNEIAIKCNLLRWNLRNEIYSSSRWI